MKVVGKLVYWKNEDGTESKGIAHDDDQIKEFKKLGKLAIREVDERFERNGNCVLKKLDNIKIIGLIDITKK